MDARVGRGDVQRYLLFPCYGVGVCKGVTLRDVQVKSRNVELDTMIVAITRGLLYPDEALSCGALRYCHRPSPYFNRYSMTYFIMYVQLRRLLFVLCFVFML